jgi:hypothetical protein
MLFEPMFLIAGGAVILVAAVDKTAETYGFYTIGTILKVVLPIAAFAAGIYFIETNPLLHWLGL